MSQGPQADTSGEIFHSEGSEDLAQLPREVWTFPEVLRARLDRALGSSIMCWIQQLATLPVARS